MRRVAWTRSKLYFLLPGDDLIRDSIPLEEIIAVEVMGESNCQGYRLINPEARRVNKDELIGRANKENNIAIAGIEKDATVCMCLNAFQIKTVADGFNSGRVYYLQAESKEMRDGTIEALRKLISHAKTKAKGTSRFICSQEVARCIYESPAFQAISALLIIVVRHRNRDGL
jgi:hypothetical protein